MSNITNEHWQQASHHIQTLQNAIAQAVIGQEEIIEQLTICILAGGHALVEGLPGLGKTLVVKAFAKAVGGRYNRVQFTPDLMPADITGHTLYDMKTSQWTVKKGSIFCNLLLADEINRASAKTQSALLEVMQEQQVTIEGVSYPVEAPFITIATQNPLDQEGTYPLPEAQLDRFLFKVLIDYPSQSEEKAMLKTLLTGKVGSNLNLSAVPNVMTPQILTNLQRLIAQVHIDDSVIDYALQIIRHSRQHNGIEVGAGSRGGIALLRTSKVVAVMNNRSYVIPDDIVKVTKPVLRHRLVLSADYRIEGIAEDKVIEQILHTVPAPRK